MGLHLIDSGTSQPRIEVMLRSSSTGQGATGIVAANVSACTWQVDGSTTLTDLALTNAAYPPAYAAGNWAAIDAARKPGAYLLDLPAAAVAAANAGKPVTVRLTGSGFLDAKETILVGPLSANAVKMLAGLIDSTTAPNLDAAVSSRAPAATALSNADLTAARILKLDNLDAAVSTRAPSNTAVSSANLTPTRIAKLDNLDAAITTRAPAATALSNTDLTAARIQKLDNLDTTVSSRAAANTAVSNADLTLARIQKLDNLDVTVGSRVSAADMTLARIQKLDNLDAAITSRAPAATALSNTDLTAARILKLDNLDAAVSTVKASADAAKVSADAAKASADGAATVAGSAKASADSAATVAGSAATAATSAAGNASTAAANAANAQAAAQAAADATGDIVTVTDKLDTMLVLSGTAYQFTAGALSQSPAASGISVLPLATTIETSTFTTSGGNLINLVHAQNSRATYTFAVFDNNSNPVDLSAKEVELAVHSDKGVVKFACEVGSGVVIGGASGNQVSVTVSETQATEAGLFYYKLWDVTDHRLLASGSFRIPLAPVVP